MGFTNTHVEEHKRRITEQAYAELKAQDPELFQACVATAVLTRDMVDRGTDSLKIASEVERACVLLALQALAR